VSAGRANALVSPDLDSGGNAYKLVQRASGVPAPGPEVQGLRRPGTGRSRSATTDDIFLITAIAALLAGDET
jgi:phosphate acetyltransferase